MQVFIDDSGDAGFRIDRGSSRFFIIAAIIFKDDLEAEKAAAVAIKELRREYHYADNVEFKFNRSRKAVRVAFLNTLTPFDYHIRCLVVDKTLIRSDELRNDKKSFYSYMIKSLLQHSRGTIKDASVKIDGSGDRIFRRQFLGYLIRQLNSKERIVVKRCRLVNSRSNVLIQMADMIAGSIHRSYMEDKGDKDDYRRIIQGNIRDEWKFR